MCKRVEREAWDEELPTLEVRIATAIVTVNPTASHLAQHLNIKHSTLKLTLTLALALALALVSYCMFEML